MQFEGIITPLVTPFVADASTINEDCLRELSDRQIADGVGGLLTCGTTGEFSSLSLSERRRVTEVVVDQAAGRVPVMAQTGSTSTAEAVALSVHAQQAGAQGLLVPPPYYGMLSEIEVTAYFRAIAEAVDIPICIYNIPSAGAGLSSDLIVSIARDVQGIEYLKDSTGDVTQQVAWLEDHANELTVLCGEELLVAPGLLYGLRGAILGCANVIGAGMAAMLRAGKANDYADVAILNAEFTPLMRFFISHPYVASVKAALALTGIDAGPVRQPLRPIEGELVAQLEDLLHAVQANGLAPR